MQQIYELGFWGSGNNPYYSGHGSHHPKYVIPYISAVSQFLSSFTNPIKVCDLGCRDFNIGKKLIPFVSEYIGVDIVPALIQFNQEKHSTDSVCFNCLNLAEEELPKADCAIVRQVLQHLSNTEIESIVPKLYQYNYLILTEHLPEGKFQPNLDIISGRNIRLKRNSGVILEAAPFNFKPIAKKQLLAIQDATNGGVIITTLYQCN
ncbi:class I SAM-dependent methyltransferase [Flavobacterium sp. ASW18X]|uniref:class I SAM-dependent methyltransferase n=1 Tax=Flavobacterium sp. ASW18X TaxID=2572595 RepID=UPI0010AE4856|nr:class I SAM-dependent methyltransferase [Flavobacterium sp. ASW18X]TKD66801.1 SAM-dependent methyltransferase [Flavobacterium sp. ASW18X]